MEEHTESESNVGYKRKYKTPEKKRMYDAKYRNEQRGNQMAEVLAKRYKEKAERDRIYEEKQNEINDAAETLVTMKNTPNMKIGGKKTRRKRNNKRKKSRKNK